ncbi:11230_t:CDS:2 [Acaulospora colombiana]|uniref:11230_t:CDS:1 n=1 Tax=Acaulospora colombiana TaxID=27376 RepID=A0ACA9K2K6_9GLOM|nr:11230_t:CDS:2 [Acaulospora colombiana]
MSDIQESTEQFSLEESATVYVDEVQGSDKTGTGERENPYQTLVCALQSRGEVKILIKKSSDGDYNDVSGAALKKARKRVEDLAKKAKKAEEQKRLDAEKERQLLAEAKLIVLERDPSLPEATKGKDIKFIILRDGTGYLQCVLTGKLCHTYDALTLTLESTITVYGVISELPEGKTAPDNHELSANYWEVIHKAPGGADAFTNQLNAEADPSVLYEQRHLVIRGETASAVLKVRSQITKAFRDHFHDKGFTEAEMAFITFDDLLNTLEDLICDTIDRVLSHEPTRELVYQLNPGFKPPERPFMRLDYKDALQYLKEHDIKKEDGTFFEFGEDIPESPERTMTDQINRPIFLCRFPAEIKSFYMKRCEDDRRITESVDVLMPGVGEIVGGSMRISDLNELLEGYKREGIDPMPYYWYTDQRKYGTTEHGGFGLGVERFIAWMLNRDTVKECCLYPRFVGRCLP